MCILNDFRLSEKLLKQLNEEFNENESSFEII